MSEEAYAGAPPAEPAPAAVSAEPAAAPVSSPSKGGTGASPANGGASDGTAAEVMRLKAVLDLSTSASADILEALQALKALGSLPTKVLSDTMIGKTVNQLAKAASDEAVRSQAKGLVEEWRQMHRKRKSSSNLADAGIQPPLKRGSSATTEASPKDGSAKSEPGSNRLEKRDSTISLGSQATGRLDRMDSTISLGSLAETASMEAGATDPNGAAGKAQMEPYREKVLQKLIEALGKEEEIETKGDIGGEERQRDPVALAGEIEEALATAKPKKEAYMSQARSVLYNLKDSKNPTFRFKLMVGFYKPEDVPGLTAEDMASDEKNAERAAQRKYAMEEIQSDWALKHGQQRITGMFTCGKCKGVKTTYFQMQTRSSDEPMTTFVTCLTCNNRWKFC